jgi:hypothetical protein
MMWIASGVLCWLLLPARLPPVQWRPPRRGGLPAHATRDQRPAELGHQRRAEVVSLLQVGRLSQCERLRVLCANSDILSIQYQYIYDLRVYELQL